MRALARQDEKIPLGNADPPAYRRLPTFRIDEKLVGIPRHNLPDSSKPAAAGLNVRAQHLLDDPPETQIAITDNTRAHPRWAVVAACAHCGDAVGELRFADSTELFEPSSAMHCPALDK